MRRKNLPGLLQHTTLKCRQANQARLNSPPGDGNRAAAAVRVPNPLVINLISPISPFKAEGRDLNRPRSAMTNLSRALPPEEGNPGVLAKAGGLEEASQSDYPPQSSSPQGRSPSPPQSPLDAELPLQLDKTCRHLRPVGGCLTNYAKAWEEITDDRWVLNIVHNGYAPTFWGSRPPLTRCWQAHESATTLEKSRLLQEQVDTMLKKEAIELVRDPKSLGFYSNVFLVPKKNGTLRPVINLRALNQFLEIPSFKMETIANVSASVRVGDWATSLDLTDGYFHVPMAPFFKKYLRFVINGKVYQFRALPFGLSTAPLVFTKMLQPLAVHLHMRGILFHTYIDDLLVRSLSRVQCQHWTQYLIELLYRLGLGVSLEKSETTPTQDFLYIGVRFLTLLGVMVPPEDRFTKIQSLGQQLIEARTCPASLWLSLIGLLGSAEKQVPLGRLRIRPLHCCLRRQFSIGVHSLSRPVSVDQESVEAVEWWMDRNNVSKGQPLGQFQPQITLYTDSSLDRWGAHADGFQASGAWTMDESQNSINCLELMAVSRALLANPQFWRNKRVMIATDNTTSVAYINKQGGTRSMALLDLTHELYRVVQDLGVTIRARHIPGRLNRTADLLSRSHQIVNTEWTMCPQVLSRVWLLWGRPHLDLMATSLTTRLPIFISPYPDPLAYGVDAMSLSWTSMDAYVFPPWAMITKVLTKAANSQCLLTAVLPRWPNRAWFPQLMQLLVDNPVRLPVFPTLIRMPHNNKLHGQLHSLDLHVCRLSSNTRLIRDFRARCPRESQRVNIGHLPRTSTNPGGKPSLFGVVDKAAIHSVLL
jgi:hypothetical protein